MEKVQPEEIVAILKEHGTPVSVEQAKCILEFMYTIANMALDIYVENAGGNCEKGAYKSSTEKFSII